MTNVERRPSVHSQDPIGWMEHSTECKTCTLKAANPKGGRQIKGKGRPKLATLN